MPLDMQMNCSVTRILTAFFYIWLNICEYYAEYNRPAPLSLQIDKKKGLFSPFTSPLLYPIR